MAMGRQEDRQVDLMVTWRELPRSPGHAFYDRLQQVLVEAGFDAFAEKTCQPYYAPRLGTPSVPPGRYFRMHLVGYFEGIDSERGIEWRCSDSLSLRDFLRLEASDRVPDHSWLSRTRSRLPHEVHDRVFGWVLGLIAEHGLVQGERLGVDASTMEANAALRTIVRRETGESYREMLKRMAQDSGIETPTREDLAKLDKKRKNKASNDDWENPNDPDAKVTKMKDGRTHLAHKAEHAVDMDSGAILAVTLQPANRGDTSSIEETLTMTADTVVDLLTDDQSAPHISSQPMSEAVADKGYHSNDVLTGAGQMVTRTYISEPDRGRRNWSDNEEARDAVYANRRRIRGARGKRLMRKRGELIERSFAHCYDTGGMRRTHLRGHENILKRLLIHVAGFNLSLILRMILKRGTARGRQGLFARILHVLERLKWRGKAAIRQLQARMDLDASVAVMNAAA